MYRIRFHGRGGQGMKTASRILGRALFISGLEVQDAPLYGAERRGAPVFAYVRADDEPINERGIISRPDLVVVADESLLDLAAAGVLQGVYPGTVLLIRTSAPAHHFQELARQVAAVHQLQLTGPEASEMAYPLIHSAGCAGAAASLLGLVSEEALVAAVQVELADQPAQMVAENITLACQAFAKLADHAGTVRPSAADEPLPQPDWLNLGWEEAERATPAIHAPLTSLKMDTGAWRFKRPIIDLERCRRCGLCNTYCPDGAISLGEDGTPQIDYRHCKGCMICLVQCPAQAISAQVEPTGEEKQ
ncbi:MAG: 2-oxoacid:acceptor oxidoreductase family protein [Thermodesulfobacteriota bacterium]